MIKYDIRTKYWGSGQLHLSYSTAWENLKEFAYKNKGWTGDDELRNSHLNEILKPYHGYYDDRIGEDRYFINFANEEDLTAFLLRFS